MLEKQDHHPLNSRLYLGDEVTKAIPFFLSHFMGEDGSYEFIQL